MEIGQVWAPTDRRLCLARSVAIDQDSAAAIGPAPCLARSVAIDPDSAAIDQGSGVTSRATAETGPDSAAIDQGSVATSRATAETGPDSAAIDQGSRVELPGQRRKPARTRRQSTGARWRHWTWLGQQQARLGQQQARLGQYRPGQGNGNWANNRPGWGNNRPGQGNGNWANNRPGWGNGNANTGVGNGNWGIGNGSGNGNGNWGIGGGNNIGSGNTVINNGGGWGGGGYSSGYNGVVNNVNVNGGGWGGGGWGGGGWGGRGWGGGGWGGGGWGGGGWGGGNGFWTGFGTGALTSFGMGALGSVLGYGGMGYGGMGYGYPAYAGYGVYDYFPTWGMSNYNSWGLGSVASNWLYSGYSNPYNATVIAAQPAQTTVVYDYSQPINVAAAAPNPATESSAEQVFSAARDAFKAGDSQRALDLTDQVLKDEPNVPVVHEFRALCLFALKRYDEAATVDYAVLSAGPGWNWSTLVELYPDVDTYTNQLRALEASVKSNPNSPAIQFLLAYHYLVQGHQDAAASQFQKVAQLQPSDQLAASFVKALKKASEQPAQANVAAAGQPGQINVAAAGQPAGAPRPLRSRQARPLHSFRPSSLSPRRLRLLRPLLSEPGSLSRLLTCRSR